MAVIRQALTLHPLKGSPPCLCRGTIAIELRSGDRLVTTLALHHHKTLRVPGLATFLDGVLRDGPALARWLAQNGHPQELEEFNDHTLGQRNYDDDLLALNRGTPPRLRHLAGTFNQDFAFSPVSMAKLSASYADSIELCQDLLRWFGAARRPWCDTGLLNVECQVDRALKELGLGIVREATEKGQTEAQVMRGAARYWTTRTRASEQFGLSDAIWQKLLADGPNAIFLAQVYDTVRRTRLRQDFSKPRSLGPPAAVATAGPYRNLRACGHGLYALRGTQMVSVNPGRVIFEADCPQATFSVAYGFQVALPSRSTIVKLCERGRRRRNWAELQPNPTMIPSFNSSHIAWVRDGRVIATRERVLVDSAEPIRCPLLTNDWLFWTAGERVLRLKLYPEACRPEVVFEGSVSALGSRGDDVIIACADRSLWVGARLVGQTHFSALAVIADEDSLYVLSEEADSGWVLENPRDGVLAGGLPASSTPSLALTPSHLYGAFGNELLAFERIP